MQHKNTRKIENTVVYRSGRIEWERSNKHLFLVSEEEERKNEACSISNGWEFSRFNVRYKSTDKRITSRINKKKSTSRLMILKLNRSS